MLKCLDATLLVEPLPDQATGIVLPDGAQLDPVGRVLVVHAGPGRFLENGHFLEMDVKAGDVLLMQPGAPVSIHKYNGRDHAFVQRRYILARESGHFADVEEES